MRGGFSRSCALAWQSVRNTREVSLTSAVLVGLSIVCVTGSERAFGKLADVVQSLAISGSGYSADVDISRCRSCERVRRASMPLQHLITETRHTRVRLLGLLGTGQHTLHRTPQRMTEVPVHCLSPERAPSGTQWVAGTGARAWSDDVGSPLVIAGANLAPQWASRDSAGGMPSRVSAPRPVRTSAGYWELAGLARTRATLSVDAGDNEALLVPYRAPFVALCNTGRPTWRVSAPDSIALQSALHIVNDELRTAMALHPAASVPWRVQRNDGFGALVKQLEQRFRGWLLLIPGVVALLCGAGVFSVQTLQGDQRIAEFGVCRAVGASRADLLGQLLAEAALIAVAGVAMAFVLLSTAGLVGGGITASASTLLQAGMQAGTMLAAGVLVPGVAALRASSIAQLEGRAT